ncbi:MAG TPA: alpha/beta hydrolase [Candidatus Edwardsbacteria bacterium]|nr:alpha/beta hydrolase [Candidatus Edwardsbacteria bacterium]
MSVLHRKISMWWLLAIPVILYAGLLIYALTCADSMLFYPHRADLPAGVNAIQLKSADGTLISAVHLRNDAARFTLLYSYGNGEDVAVNIPFFRDLQKAGFAVFAYDYPGYGMSAGRPSEQGICRAIDAAYDYLTTTAKVPPGRIIVCGRSLGGGAACDLAAHRPVAGLIMISPFVSAFRVLTRIPLLPFDKFNNIRKIERVTCPVLLIHGGEDRTIAFWHSQALLAAANQPKRLVPVPGTGHNDMLSSAAAFQRVKTALAEFAASLPVHNDQ